MSTVLCLRPEADFARVGALPPASLSVTYLKPDDPSLPQRMKEARALVVPAVGAKLPPTLFEGTELKLVQVTGAGLDRLDQAALTRLKIPVANVLGNEAVAEYAVTVATLLRRRLGWADSEIKNGHYAAFRARMLGDNLTGLDGLLVGIIGLGVIGLAVAQAFHQVGCRICYHDPAPQDPKAAAALDATPMALPDLLAATDIVSIHVPLLDSTRGLIGVRELDLMKEGAVLIQAARGGVVDEAALAAALRSERLGGAAVDVYSTEPPAADNPLLRLDGEAAQKLLLTPHIAGVTRQSSAFLFRSAWQNVERVLIRNEFPLAGPIEDATAVTRLTASAHCRTVTRTKTREKNVRNSVARLLASLVLPAALMLASTATLRAEDDVAAFYKGKTMRMMVGVPAGTGTDLIARMLMRHIVNHIPGNPTMIAQNIPGAGSVQMANNVANSAVRDGTVIGASLNGLPTSPLLTPKIAHFDSTKLIWLGSMYRSNNIAYAWHTSPVQTLEQLKTQELIIGTPGPGSGSYDLAVLSRELLGLKFKLVRGYEGSGQVNIAMERGEVQAQIVGWDSFQAARPTWIADGVVKVIGHYSLEDPPELRPYPRIVDLAKTDADRQALRLVLARQAHGRPYFLPPDVPAARVEALRRAFDATMKDPAFLEDAKNLKVDVSPMTGEETQALIAQVQEQTPAAVVERVRAIMEAPAN